jgi:hypothetical protein
MLQSRPPRAEAGSLTLEVPKAMVDQALKVANTLPKQLLPHAPNTRPEEAALKAALRVGLTALQSLKPE